MKSEIVPGTTSLWPIIPLSYVEDSYRLRIIEEGKRYFSDRLKPITEITQLNDYVGMLRGWASLIVNHLRQQAAGRLIISLLSSRGCEANERNTEQVIRALARMGEQKATRRKGYY